MFDDSEDEDIGGSILDQLRTVREEEREAENYIEEELEGQVQELKAQHQQAVDTGKQFGHAPVLLWSSLEFLFQQSRLLDKKYTGTYVDCTFGRGGFSREMLARLHDRGRLFAFDIDPTAVREGKQLEQADPRFRIFHEPFTKLPEVLEGETIDGIIMDIGVSSPQLDNDTRGFSLQTLKLKRRPVDLRMNQEAGKSAAEWLQSVSVEQLAWVLHAYGPYEQSTLQAERTAQAIMDDQELNGPFTSMNRLARVAGTNAGFSDEAKNFEHPALGFDHPARLTVQSIRMFLNRELEQLTEGLVAAMKVLVPGGRLLVNAFKRAESKVITEFILQHEEPDLETRKRVRTARRIRELYPLVGTDLDYSVRVLGRPVKPSVNEVLNNKRARSGHMYVLEKVPRAANVKQVRAKPRLERNRLTRPAFLPIQAEPAEA